MEKMIIAFVGPAGAGKDYLVRQLLKKHPEWNPIVSCTTRPPRQKEEEGKDYFFISVEDFIQKVLNGDMLEATCFNNWHYGTMASSIHEGINLGVFNPEGYDCLITEPPKDIKIVGILVDADAKTRMLRQLTREEDPDVNEICRRFSADEKDFSGEFDLPSFVVSNGKGVSIQDVVADVESFIYQLMGITD